ncbi:MAG: phosphoglycerate dehydrogenase [Puniceicoccaceae bacterium]
MKKVLVTTTSFQDTPGSHQDLLNSCNWQVSYARGPLSENQILELVGDFDGIICGDDVFSRRVFEKALPRLQFLSKYGIGVDKIDVQAATELGIPVFFTPGVNHTTVAEHTFMLMLMLVKKAPFHINAVRQGQWKRQTGNEIWGKTIGIVGLGRIGKEVALRAKAFGLKVIGYDVYWDDVFASEHGITRAASYDQVWSDADFITLHTNLNAETHHLVRNETLAKMKDGVYIVNCARGEIVHTQDMVQALQSGKVAGYGTDVLDDEPPRPDHALLSLENCIITPHIGSRTYESVVRQATKSIQNLKNAFEGKQPLAQVNQVPIVK